MGAALSSTKTVNIYQITWRHSPEGSILHSHRYENLNSSRAVIIDRMPSSQHYIRKAIKLHPRMVHVAGAASYGLRDLRLRTCNHIVHDS
jgi:hypothetical protein